MHLSDPEVGWKRYGNARITSPLAYNALNFLKDDLQGSDADIFFFYLGE